MTLGQIYATVADDSAGHRAIALTIDDANRADPGTSARLERRGIWLQVCQ